MVATFRDRKSRQGTGATAHGRDQGREKRIAFGTAGLKAGILPPAAADFAIVAARSNIVER